MRRLIMTMLLAMTSITICHSQEITVIKVLGDNCFIQDGRKMSMNDLVKKMEPYDDIYQVIRRAQSDRFYANIFGFSGGALLGWTGADALRGREVNWTLVLVGAGLVGVSIPFSKSENKRALRAVELYNSSLSSVPKQRSESDLGIGLTGNGFGLTMTFK
ncbi:MAG: hypothetical protein R3275_02090 [Saprospiraceae bacterium]|nr:hypothetical protein [Saprospiraceae bacterium]